MKIGKAEFIQDVTFADIQQALRYCVAQKGVN
jgi:hypothetical protein